MNRYFLHIWYPEIHQWIEIDLDPNPGIIGTIYRDKQPLASLQGTGDGIAVTFGEE